MRKDRCGMIMIYYDAGAIKVQDDGASNMTKTAAYKHMVILTVYPRGN